MRTWRSRNNRFSFPRTVFRTTRPILFSMESVLGFQITCVVSGFDSTIKHSRIRAWLVCCWAETELVKPSSWNWTGNLCACHLPGSMGLSSAQNGEVAEEISCSFEAYCKSIYGFSVHVVANEHQIHRWIGRILAILGIIQIPLGLTLYGSPKVLFILFAIMVFTLLVTFMVLSYLYDVEGYSTSSEYDSRGSYVSGPSRSHGYDDSRTSYIDEKYSEEPRHSGWKKKLLEMGALGGAAVLAKKFFDRRRNRDDEDAESGRYSRTHTRSDSMTEETMSRMEDGRRPEPTHRTPLFPAPSRPPSRPQSPGSSYYNSTYLSNNRPEESHAGRNAFFGAGALGALKNLFSGRKGNAEQRRLEEMRRQEMEDERLARANSKRRNDAYQPRNRREDSFTDTTSTDLTRPPHGASGVSGRPGGPRPYDGPHSSIPPPPPAHHDLPSEVTKSDVTETESEAAAPVPSSHRRQNSLSGLRDEHRTDSPPLSVKLRMHNDGRHVTLRRLTEEEAAANREAKRRERRSSRRRHGSVSSNDEGEEGGSTDRWRRVEELERQQQEQIEREREAAAAESQAPSSFVYGPPPQAPPPQPHSRMGPIPRPPAGPVPPPHPRPHPPPPSSSLPYGAGSIGSPGTFTGTEASGDYANNRRRRRAERARARQERQNVDFT